jgi:hypothetical protein
MRRSLERSGLETPPAQQQLLPNRAGSLAAVGRGFRLELKLNYG